MPSLVRGAHSGPGPGARAPSCEAVVVEQAAESSHPSLAEEEAGPSQAHGSRFSSGRQGEHAVGS